MLVDLFIGGYGFVSGLVLVLVVFCGLWGWWLTLFCCVLFNSVALI